MQYFFCQFNLARLHILITICVPVSVSGAGVGSFGTDLTFRGVLAQIWNPATNTTVGTYQDETKLTKSTCAGGTGATHETSADKTSKFLLFKVGAPQQGTDLECRYVLLFHWY